MQKRSPFRALPILPEPERIHVLKETAERLRMIQQYCRQRHLRNRGWKPHGNYLKVSSDEPAPYGAFKTFSSNKMTRNLRSFLDAKPPIWLPPPRSSVKVL